ncbi:hypothetical protein [Streptomyces sp. NBC_01565]|uniref:hypothetical protein n=1 Tax=unclassified Streptomyces TaxID=2593676 RepID=UPI0022579332|nr:hypothetical protein [Streptomyces sp. NBC_01565]MCX4546247.1 hypothetical protein [Streptomyces sp. NBC_01565]
MPANRRTTAAAIAVVAVAGALLSGAPAQAHGASPNPAAPAKSAAPKGDGSKAICKRLPKTEARVSAALTRLNGDATVSGSIARLEQRVAEAKSAGHIEVHTYLNDRLTFRKSLVPTLRKRQEDLKAVSTWCAAQGSK